jgi:PAS domain S-box-containing protein
MTTKPTYEELERRLIALEKESGKRKEADEALSSQIRLMNALLDNLQVGIFMAEAPSGKPLLANKRALELLGRDIISGAVKETLAENYRAYRRGTDDLYPKDEMPIVRAMAGENCFIDDMVVLRPDNSKTLLEVFGSPVRDKQGNIIAGLISFSDITKEKQREDRFRTISELTSDYAYAYKVHPDGQLSLEWVTGALKRITGFTREEILARGGWESLIYPDDLSIPLGLLQSLFANQARTVEYRILTKSKDIKWMRDFARPVWDENKKCLKVIYGAVRDITERRRAEKELRESEEKFRTLVEESPLGISLIGKNGHYKYVNPRFEEIFGYAIGDILTGQEWFKKAYPDDEYRKQVIKIWTEDQQEKGVGQAQPRTFTVTCKDGSCKEIHFRSVTLKHQDQFVIYEDITERKRAEEALRKSHQTFLTVLDGIDATIYAADMETHEILFMNQHMINVFNDDFTGRICHEVFRGESSPCSHCTNDRLIDADGNPTGVCTWETKNPITGKWYINYDRAIRWIDGRIVRLQIATDISKFKELDQERIQTEAQLRQAQKMESVGRLAGGVAHDFNNMLGVILGRAEMMLMELEPGNPLVADLKEIHNATRRSADLTRQLLAFARKQTIRPKVLDLNDTLEEMLKMLRRLIGEDIELTWRPRANLWPVKVDPAQIDQILANLCVNARDAIGGVGKVIIETDNVTIDEAYCQFHAGFLAGKYAMVAVSDDGCGMNKETLENLFEPFFTTKKIGEGTGLGLSTVYGIVKQNNGFINVYSELEQGTTFKIYLPRTEEIVEAEGQSDTEAIPKGTETVLLVEDEESILNVSKIALEHFGYTVLSARIPGDALDIINRHGGPIHLLITDLVMPGMNGKELAEEIEKREPDIKVIFMSGYTGNAIAHRGILESNVHFLPKPFSINSLAQKVREVLDH